MSFHIAIKGKMQNGKKTNKQMLHVKNWLTCYYTSALQYEGTEVKQEEWAVSDCDQSGTERQR